MSTTVYVMGWFGAVGLLFAFVLSSIGKLDNQKAPYHFINFFCGAMLIVNAYVAEAYPFFIINIFWVITSFYALIKIHLRKASST